ncbi:hypothetical protein ACFO3I_07135 [Rheinheimera marina]|uniref:Preprotein translocase subunit SecB n=1 Tax=Rheinheimera marina TaxID=1774958 RepID=A0ABV9JKK0_9GAMM
MKVGGEAMNLLLQEAIDHLSINDVYLVHAQSSVAADSPAKYENFDLFQTQTRSALPAVSAIELKDGQHLVRVECGYGFRWVEEAEGQEPVQKACIEATFAAEYVMKKVISNEAIAEFSKKNVHHHVWPFWREFLMSQTERMRLPRVTVHMCQFGFESIEKSTEREGE